MKIKNDIIINELIDQYTLANTSERPCIIGFRRGKDSILLLNLVWRAFENIKKQMPYPFQLRGSVYVVCNEIMVKNPIIRGEKGLDKIIKDLPHSRNPGGGRKAIYEKQNCKNWPMRLSYQLQFGTLRREQANGEDRTSFILAYNNELAGQADSKL